MSKEENNAKEGQNEENKEEEDEDSVDIKWSDELSRSLLLDLRKKPPEIDIIFIMLFLEALNQGAEKELTEEEQIKFEEILNILLKMKGETQYLKDLGENYKNILESFTPEKLIEKFVKDTLEKNELNIEEKEYIPMYQIDYNQPVHVHFIGIGGISMSGLAAVLLKRGFTVSGSDAKESPLTVWLTELGATVDYGQCAENIRDGIDVVVYTAAIHPDNP
ncbi:MAG: Mur ligase domain-containing protein, partial [archaeon]|nr:Mur ligase domain-containing protein [archaeon]